ncbi:hypothetical protein ARMGADRAFT_1091369 [Armillaria gallica]|uniref:Uncharacterized protein n=1 Tax=Armillaria gallica TaxID=47427 RepID=A0A2H3D1E6_ARMGA|nr:hypothetical protein ARMGADRAFT_1091369 [Armillaria gallica]
MRSATGWADAATSFSQRPTSSVTLNNHTSPQSGWRTKNLKKDDLSPDSRGRVVTERGASMPADTGMGECACPWMGNADTSMCAPSAKEDTLSPLALGESERGGETLEGRGRFKRENKGGDWEEGDVGFAPKYKQGFVFLTADSGRSRAASCTEYKLPVPRPPAKEFENAEAIKMIKDHPQLFKITTPIKVDMLKSYLDNHPNPGFVSSVMTTLKEGFWPWADTHHMADFPITWDNVRMSPRSGMEQQFIAKY